MNDTEVRDFCINCVLSLSQIDDVSKLGDIADEEEHFFGGGSFT